MPFAGLYTPLVTPFTGDGELDLSALAFNVRRYAATPLTGVVVLGSNGEAVQLDEQESDAVVDTVRQVWPRDRPMLVGSGRESTRATIDASRRAAALGADAVMVRTPSFYKTQLSAAVLEGHYRAIADAAPVPVFLYNVTMYTGINLLPDVIGRLSEHPNIVGLKESGNDMAQFAATLAAVRPDFAVLAGSAATFYAAATLGAHGGVLALAGLLPEACARLWSLVREAKHEEALALQRVVSPIGRLVGSAHGIPGLKAALTMAGYRAGLPRAPLQAVSAETHAAIRLELDSIAAAVAPDLLSQTTV